MIRPIRFVDMSKVIFLLSVALLAFNFRYFVDIVESSRIFISIYDFTANYFHKGNATFLMENCLDNNCSKTNYTLHPNWAVAFFNSYFKEQNLFTLRNTLLLVHIFSNSVSLLLMMVQPWAIRNNYKTVHKYFGYLSVFLLVTGISSSSILASYHHNIDAYGGQYSSVGFYQMGLTCVIPALLGLFYILQGNVKLHKKWMVRALGAMWGSFFIFRILEFIVFPIFVLINSEKFSNPVLVNIWFSAIMGVFLNEWYFSEEKSKKNKKVE
jgi:hypothetical protein